jgi:isopentenyl-diphosphate delta-isomerase
MRRITRLLSHISSTPTTPTSPFPLTQTIYHSPTSNINLSTLLQHHDALQVQMMEERIIVVDTNDVPIRSGTKVECHINQTGDNNILLHRAFSVFLFDDESGKLLLQKRSPQKITFPSYWANTCCSHPMYTPEELEDGIGVKRAAIRKLEQELGIPTCTFDVQDFRYLTTILYLAPGEGGWGEHEVDHILAIRVKKSKLKLNPNPNEVAECKWVNEEELQSFIEHAPRQGIKISPWFAMIQKQFLHTWWKHYRETGSFDALAAKATRDIHKLTL